MSSPAKGLNASDAAKRLGVSIKALRLYERQGLLSPGRRILELWFRPYGPRGHFPTSSSLHPRPIA